MANKAMAPLKFQEKIEIRFEQMDDSKTIDTRLAGIFFNHDISRLAPPGNCDAAKYNNIHELGETLEKSRVLDQSLVMA